MQTHHRSIHMHTHVYDGNNVALVIDALAACRERSTSVNDINHQSSIINHPFISCKPNATQLTFGNIVTSRLNPSGRFHARGHWHTHTRTHTHTHEVVGRATPCRCALIEGAGWRRVCAQAPRVHAPHTHTDACGAHSCMRGDTSHTRTHPRMCATTLARMHPFLAPSASSCASPVRVGGAWHRVGVASCWRGINAIVPACHCAIVLLSHRAIVPSCPRAIVPACHLATVPASPERASACPTWPT